MNPLDKIKEALPSTPGIMGKEELYFNSSITLLLIEADNQLNFLLQKRSPHIRQGGEICFPGGMYDPEIDKDYKDTAVRECSEELGIPLNYIEVIGQMDTLVAAMGATVDVFVAKLNINSLEELNINSDEVHKVFLAPVDYFRKNPPREYSVRVEVQPYYTDSNGNSIVTLPSKDLGLPERYHQPWGGRDHAIYLYKYQEHTIWGLTAHIIREFIKVM